MVHECLKAADELAKSGKKADGDRRVLAAAEDRRAPRRSPRAAAGRIVTVEDNYTGGLDAEIATAIANSGDDITLKNLYVSQIPKSGREPQDVLDYLDLGVKAILEAVS